MRRVPSPRTEFGEWSRRLRACSGLRSVGEVREYSALVAAVRGQERRECFFAIVDSIRKRHDHGVYEGTFNALWRFEPARFGPWMVAALPDFLARMNRHEQVQRFLGPLASGFGVRALPEFVQAMQRAAPTHRSKILRAMKGWARGDEHWARVLEEHFGARPLKPPADSAIPVDWPARWRRHAREATTGHVSVPSIWERWKRADVLDYLVAVVIEQPEALIAQVPRLFTPLGTYASRSRADFIGRLAKLDPKKRAGALEYLARAARRDTTGLFRRVVYKQISDELRNPSNRGTSTRGPARRKGRSVEPLQHVSGGGR